LRKLSLILAVIAVFRKLGGWFLVFSFWYLVLGKTQHVSERAQSEFEESSPLHPDTKSPPEGMGISGGLLRLLMQAGYIVG
jgi:hypothetical protein